MRTHDGRGPEEVTYARRLASAAAALAGFPRDRLTGSLGRARAMLEAAGPRLARDAAWLRGREDYLVDAAAGLAGEVARLEVALAAPAESDLSVRVTAVLDAVRYLRDVAADLVPPRVYLDVGRDLLPAIGADYAAPAVALRLVPLVDAVLQAMRAACDVGLALTRQADAVLADPPPGMPADQPQEPLYAVHCAEIDRLIAAVGAARPELAARPPEDEQARERALRDGLDLTPGQLDRALAGLPDPAA